MKKLIIRPVAVEEIDLLDRHLAFGDPAKHRERFGKQQGGEITYLIAWHESLPVGHILLKWEGIAAEPWATNLKDCPILVDLFVVPGYRSKGVGSLLLEAAEALAMEQGYRQVGLGVGVDNVRAHSLYERIGYRDSGLGEHIDSGSFLDMGGMQRHWEEICLYLIKDLQLFRSEDDEPKRREHI